MGPQGAQGVVGNPFLAPLGQMVTDSSVIYVQVIKSLWLSSSNDLTFSIGRVASAPAPSLKLVGVGPAGSGVLAVDYATSSAKPVAFYSAPVVSPVDTNLVIPQWTPLKACNDRRRFLMSNFLWFNQIDQSSSFCGVPFQPFNILTDPVPPEQCCREDFFHLSKLNLLIF